MSNFAKISVFIWLVCGVGNAVVASAKAARCNGPVLGAFIMGVVAGPPLTIAVLMNGSIPKSCPKEPPQ